MLEEHIPISLASGLWNFAHLSSPDVWTSSCKALHSEMVAKFSFANPGEVDRLSNQFPLWNGAPRLIYPIIVVDELVRGTTMFVPARWGLIPYWVKDPRA